MSRLEFLAKIRHVTAAELRDVLSDIWVEDDRLNSINDLDHQELLEGVMQWVDEGVERGEWSFESWLHTVADIYGWDV